MMPAPPGYSHTREACGPSKDPNWWAQVRLAPQSKGLPSRSPATAIPPLSVGRLITIAAPPGYSHARAACGPSKAPNWWAQVRLATQGKGFPSQFPVTVLLPSWVGLLTTMGRVLRGYSPNNQCSPGHPEGQTVTA